jgi:glycosyltransferase involved in cell wall biosynthesis
LYLSQNPTGFLRDAVIVWLARAAGARVVAHVRGASFQNFYTQTAGWRRALVTATVRQLRAVILVADRLRPQFAGLLPEPRIRVLRNPVDTWSEPPTPVGFRMLFMGHLSHAKGFGDLLAAVPAVLDRIPDAALAAAGEWLDVETNILADEQGAPVNSDAAALRRQWDDLVARYPGRVHYHGVLTGAEKRAVIASSAVLVLPSYSEGLPMAVLEGMAAGLPVVATPVGALPEIIEDRRQGRIVLPGDPRALSEALVALATDREAAGAMGARNRAYVAAHCSPAAIRAGLSAILAEAAA